MSSSSSPKLYENALKDQPQIVKTLSPFFLLIGISIFIGLPIAQGYIAKYNREHDNPPAVMSTTIVVSFFLIMIGIFALYFGNMSPFIIILMGLGSFITMGVLINVM